MAADTLIVHQKLYPPFDHYGYCPICEAPAHFVADTLWFRDSLVCDRCRSIPRERALMDVLNLTYPRWRDLTIHEAGPVMRGVSARCARDCAAYVVSQYDASLPFGSRNQARGYQSEDLEAQTFSDASFDIVITQDVFEHLFEPARAIAEIARTLRPGGAHICTVPIVRKGERSRRRARRLADGTVENMLEPVYHGNPMDPNGSLVVMDWGYDITEFIDAHSGMKTTMYYIDNLDRGIRAEFIEVLVSRKPL